MTSTSEILRRIDNIVQIGTICEIKPDKALAKVNILNRVTNFMPVLSFANTFKRHFTPIAVGEQVLVFCIGGQADNGIIIRGMFYKDDNGKHKEPDGSNENVEVIEYKDGTTIQYEENKITIDARGDIEITAGKNIKLNAVKEIKLTADKIYLNE